MCVWTHPQQHRWAEALHRERPLCHRLFRGQHPGGGVGTITLHMINAGPLSARSSGEGDSMPRGINRPASQTGTRPPLCMLDRRSCGCLESRANLLQWLGTEMKGADLEKFKGRVSLTVDPHLCFSLSSLPAWQPLLIFHLTFTIASSSSPLFVSIFHTRPHLNFILPSASVSVSQVSSRSTGSTTLGAKNLTRQALSFKYSSYVGSVPCKYNRYDMRENAKRLWALLLYMCLVLLTSRSCCHEIERKLSCDGKALCYTGSA